MVDKTPDQIVAELSAWCKQRRGRVTQAALAIGVPSRRLTDWLNGSRRPNWAHGKAIEAFMRRHVGSAKRKAGPGVQVDLA